MMFEVEAKFRVADPEALRRRIVDARGIARGVETHRDTYLDRSHQPLRDAGAALRIRHANGQVYLTYKGPRLAGEIKAREEIELALADVLDAEAMAQTLIDRIGFGVVAVVLKRREIFELDTRRGKVHVFLDHVDRLGCFAEIEVLSHRHGLEAARATIADVSRALGLDEAIQTSYLTMLLAVAPQPPRAADR